MAWNPERARTDGYLHPKKVARILAQHGHICHLCGHGGADEVDHIVPWSEWTHPTVSVHHPSNLAPAHGARCTVCGVECHVEKTKVESARGRARAQAERKAQASRPTEKHPGCL